MEMSIDQMLQQSIGAHNAGNLQEAERLYRTILQVQPKHPDANHNLGLIALSKNQPDAALALFKTATEANSNIEQFWLTYIEVLITQGQFEDAVKAGNIPAQVPSQAEIQNLTNHYKNGQYDAAEKLAMLLTQQFPENQFSWKVLGAVLGQTGRKSEAVNANQKAVALSPQDAEAHSNLGITLQELGRLDEAEASYRKAIALKPDFTEAHSNLGITLKELGRLEEAEASYRQAITLESGYAEAHSNLGITLQELGRLEEAEASYAQAIALKSDYAEAYSNLGVTLQELGRLEEAEASCRQAIALKSDYAGALNNLGMTLQQLGRLKEAEASYTQAIALKPDYAEAYSNLGVTLNAMGLKESALQHFERNLQLERGINPVNLRHKSFRTISKAKIDHDIEQFEYLAASGYDIKKFRELATLYKTVSSEINCTLDTDILPLSDKHQSLLGDTYNRPIHILEAPALDESTIGDCLDVNKITEDYFEHEFGLTYFDDFLTPTTLYSLREFLLGSTIWFDFSHDGGYMGAYMKDGLACPLTLQIAEDLRKKFPKIFKNHQLTQFWAYKYDSRACDKNNSFTGIRAHADAAAVNVNFWITPKSANLDPSSGGLVVYNAEAPLEWGFKTYNNLNEEKLQEVLESDKTKTIVPYNENRVVMFNSNLLHETDNIEFKEGYENRRINVTMLFGNRGL
jgi:Flp pilus assembly protein TadD